MKAGINSAKTEAGRERIEKMRIHDGYAECEWEEGDLPITGNWNDVSRWDDQGRQIVSVDKTPSRVANCLEKVGAELEWSDEWETCTECGLLIRINPDSYGWTPNWVELDEGKVCESCLDIEEYLMSIEGCSTSVNTVAGEDDLNSYGYVKIKDWERGMHPGQDADPLRIGDYLIRMDVGRWLFHMESKGQFDIRFALYIHTEELDKGIKDPGYPSRAPRKGISAIAWLQKDYLNSSRTHGPSVSAAMERGLREASRLTDQLKGDGIRYAKVTPEGVTAKLVSPKDFIEGRIDDDD